MKYLANTMQDTETLSPHHNWFSPFKINIELLKHSRRKNYDYEEIIMTMQ